jgi:uncharacterized membrane protein
MFAADKGSRSVITQSGNTLFLQGKEITSLNILHKGSVDVYLAADELSGEAGEDETFKKKLQGFQYSV